MSDSRSGVLVTVDEVADRVSDTARLVILDISDDLDAAPLERPVIPGPLAVSLASEFSGPPTKPGGRRPLPDAGALQENMRRWGIDAETFVVVYDNASGAQAGRARWTLRWAGHASVNLLDGGLAAWIAAEHDTAAQPVHPAGSGGFTVKPGCMPVIEADEAAEIAHHGALLDARGKSAYEGEADKPATDHIPGAICVAALNTPGPDGCFKSTEELRALFAELGAAGSQLAGVYCGSDNAAAFELAGLYAAGREAPLYVGSWSAWTGYPARPVANGPERG